MPVPLHTSEDSSLWLLTTQVRIELWVGKIISRDCYDEKSKDCLMLIKFVLTKVIVHCYQFQGSQL